MKRRNIHILIIIAAAILIVCLVTTLGGFKKPPGRLELLLELDYSGKELTEKDKKDMPNQALEIIRNRIQDFGLNAYSVEQDSLNRILIKLPLIEEVDRLKELICVTAVLEFKLVASDEKIEEVYQLLDNYLAENPGKYPFLKELDLTDETDFDVLSDESDSSNGINEGVRGLFSTLVSVNGIPGAITGEHITAYNTLMYDNAFLGQIPDDIQIALGRNDRNDPFSPCPVYILHAKSELSGDLLDKAMAKIGQGYDPKTSGKAYVSLEFNREGAKTFKKVTGENIKRRLAIVFDGKVFLAPVIQDKIPNGEAQITGDFTADEAKDIAIVLRSGSLPVPVNIINLKTVEPGEGKDN